ncbi:MAG: YfhO family protein [Candidatus Melainabacteria bacterium]|nr:YfhO family protein [Candidatus Melainabacteria bacterium]
MTKESKNLLLLSGSILVFLVIFYWPYLSGQGSFFLSDATFWLEPQAKYLRDSIWSGRFPLWNPWNYCGMPQIAIPFPSLFYLPDWLFVLLPFNPALALSMAFHQTLAFTAMYLMLRHFKISSWGAVTGAVVYSLSGYMFGLSNNHSLVAGAAWFPLFFLSTIKVLECNSDRDGFKFSLAMCATFFFLIASGRPEVYMPSILITLGAAIGILIVRRHQNTFSSINLFWFARSLFLGMVFSLPILLPMGEWLASSRRALGLSSYEIFLYSANWYDLLSTVIGPCLGDTRLHGNPFRILVSHANLPAYVACAYVGPIAFMLGLLGVFDKTWNSKTKFAIGLLFCVTVLLSLGDTLQFAETFLKIFPMGSFIRFPVKLLFVPIWCLSIFAAKGVDALLNRSTPNAVPLIFSCLLVAAGSILFFASQKGRLLYIFRYSSELPTMFDAQSIIAKSLLFVGLISLIYVLLLIALKSHPKQCVQLSLTALTISLILNAFGMERIFAPAAHFSKSSYVAQKIRDSEKSDRFVRSLNLTYERFTVPELFQSQNLLERTIGELQYHRQILRPNTNVDSKIAEAFGFEGSMNGEYYNVLFNSYFKSNQTIRPELKPTTDFPLLRFATISSARYLITQIERINKAKEAVPIFSPTDLEMIVEDKAFNLRVYKNSRALPRCFVTYKWISETSHNKVLESIISPNSSWRPWDIPIIEDTESSKKSSLKPVRELKISYDSPEKIQIEAESDEPAYLILLDRIYPGWKATIDGSEVKILTANAFFRAIKIPAGSHHVEFTYQPKSLLLGLLLAFLGLALVVYFKIRFCSKVRSIKYDTVNGSEL